MTRDRALTPPPMRVWLGCLVVIATMWCTSYLFFKWRDEALRRENAAVNVKGRFSGEVSVYALGTSLIECALPDDGQIDLHDGKGYQRYQKVTVAGGRAGDILKLMRNAMERGNCTVFVESNPLSSQIKPAVIPKGFFDTVLAHRRRCANEIALLVNKPKAFKGRFVEVGTDPNFSWKNYASRAREFKVRTRDELHDWFALLHDASERNVTVYVLDLPRSKKARRYLPSGFEEAASKLIHSICEETGVLFFEFPMTLDYPEHYRDSAHFNAKGRAVYSQWFQKALEPKNGKTASRKGGG